MPDRSMPPLDADEPVTLSGWLDFYRATLAGKCDGLDEQQLRNAAVPPSPLTLLCPTAPAARSTGRARSWAAGSRCGGSTRT